MEDAEVAVRLLQAAEGRPRAAGARGLESWSMDLISGLPHCGAGGTGGSSERESGGESPRESGGRNPKSGGGGVGELGHGSAARGDPLGGWAATLARTAALGPPHVSVYDLQVKEAPQLLKEKKRARP